MLKKIGFALLVWCSLNIALAANEQMLNTMADRVSVRNATVEFAEMGPLGQPQTNARSLSTEVKMDLRNQGNNSVKLIAATSDAATLVQLHEIVSKMGQQRMEQIQEIDIHAKSETDLSYQGIHLMLIGLKKALSKNESIPITLIFADGSYQQVHAIVQN